MVNLSCIHHLRRSAGLLLRIFPGPIKIQHTYSMHSGFQTTLVKARLWHLHFGLSDLISMKMLFEKHHAFQLLAIYVSVCFFVCLSVCLFVCSFVRLQDCLFVCLFGLSLQHNSVDQGNSAAFCLKDLEMAGRHRFHSRGLA